MQKKYLSKKDPFWAPHKFTQLTRDYYKIAKLRIIIGHQDIQPIFQHHLDQPFCLHPEHFLYFNQVTEKSLTISLTWCVFQGGKNGTCKKEISTSKSPGRCAHHIYDIRAYIFRLSCLDGHVVRH